MSFAKRVVLDTSTLIGAVLRTIRAQTGFLMAVAGATLCASPATLAELERVSMREKFDRYLDRETRGDFLVLYRSHVHLSPVSVADEMAFRNPAAIHATTSFWRWPCIVRLMRWCPATMTCLH